MKPLSYVIVTQSNSEKTVSVFGKKKNKLAASSLMWHWQSKLLRIKGNAFLGPSVSGVSLPCHISEIAFSTVILHLGWGPLWFYRMLGYGSLATRGTEPSWREKVVGDGQSNTKKNGKKSEEKGEGWRERGKRVKMERGRENVVI